MINAKFRVEGKELIYAGYVITKKTQRIMLGFGIFLFISNIILLLMTIRGSESGLEPADIFLFSIVFICSLIIFACSILILPKFRYKLLEKKKHFIIDGVEYDLTIDNGVVTLKEKNSRAEQVTTMKVSEYKKVIVKDKYMYFLIGKRLTALQIIAPIDVFTPEDREELVEVFGDKYKIKN